MTKARKRKPGRPPLQAGGFPERLIVRLSRAHVARARDAGAGNVSAGIRYALEQLPAPCPRTK